MCGIYLIGLFDLDVKPHDNTVFDDVGGIPMRRQRQSILDDLAKHTEQINAANAKKRELLDKALRLHEDKPDVNITPCESDIPDPNPKP